MSGSRIGVAQVEITPDRPGPTSGWGIGFGTMKATPPHDPAEKLYATALALSGPDGAVAVVATIDIHCGSRPVWEGAARFAGIDPGRLILSGSHSHAGPGQPYGGFVFALGSTSPFGLGRMRRHLIERIGTAVKDAVAALAPGGVAIVRGDVVDVGNNRATPAWSHYADDDLRDFADGPGRSLADREAKAERYRDPRITLLVAAGDDGRQRGILGWYGVHPNSLGPKWPTYSADLYGWARRRIEQDLPGAVVGFGGGAAGDISPLTLDDDGHLRHPHSSAADLQGSELAGRHGDRIGAVVAGLVADARPVPFPLAVAHLDWRPTETLPDPCYGMTQFGAGVDGPTSKWPELEAGVRSDRARSLAHRQFSTVGGQGPKIPWLYSLTKLPIPLGWFFRLSVPKTLPLHAVRIADHIFGTVPGEPTTMAGWRIERELLRQTTASTASVVGYAGDYCGYWTTPEEYLEQRYEAASTVFGAQAVPELQRRLARLARETEPNR
jgi:neutral ceramidase